MNTNKNDNYKFVDDLAITATKLVGFLWETGKTFVRDVASGRMPGFKLTVISLVCMTAVFFHFDFYLLWRLHLPVPKTGGWFYRGYILFVAAFPYLAWAVVSQAKRMKYLKDLENAFVRIPIKSALGETPTYHSERAVDRDVRSLLLRNPYISVEEYKKKKEQLGSALKGRVIDIKERRNDRLIEIKYANREISAHLPCDNPANNPNFGFMIGQGYERGVKSSLVTHPHMLIGGQTGGGKSTFLRQLITTLYLSNQNKIEMTLVDLKEGIEFEVFDDLPFVRVYSEIKDATAQITSLRDMLKERGELLKKNGAKQLTDLPAASRPKRQLLVIDEAADVFLNGPGKASKDVLQVREAISLIARKGRATGIHLIIATQKPDSRAIDPQVKSCLPTAVCFPMVDDASSISILGNGRATDLPSIKGRAIWKDGGEQLEVQTPFLSDTEAKELLAKYRVVKTKATSTKTSPASPNASDVIAINESAGPDDSIDQVV